MTAPEKLEDIREYLPWYVNGSLDDKTRQSVEIAIAASPTLKAEVHWLQSLQSSLKEDKSLSNIPEDIGLARFNTLIKNEQAGKVASLPSRWQQWQRPLMAVAATVMVVQMGVIGMLVNNQSDDASITTLSGEQTPAISNGVLLQVVFSDSATAADIRTSLNHIGGEIVAGPGVMGVYTVQVETGDARALMTQLSKQNGVESVTQLGE